MVVLLLSQRGGKLLSFEHTRAQSLSEQAERHMRDAARLYEQALLFEEAAAKKVPDDQPKTKRILTESAQAIKHKATTLRGMFEGKAHD